MKSFVKTLQTSLTNHNNEARLFCAIIYQAIEDADYKGSDKRYLRYKQQALDWLLSMSDDFCTICNMAGFNPEYVRDQIKKLSMYGRFQFNQKQYDTLYDASKIKRTVIKLIP